MGVGMLCRRLTRNRTKGIINNERIWKSRSRFSHFLDLPMPVVAAWTRPSLTEGRRRTRLEPDNQANYTLRWRWPSSSSSSLCPLSLCPLSLSRSLSSSLLPFFVETYKVPDPTATCTAILLWKLIRPSVIQMANEIRTNCFAELSSSCNIHSICKVYYPQEILKQRYCEIPSFSSSSVTWNQICKVSTREGTII